VRIDDGDLALSEWGARVVTPEDLQRIVEQGESETLEFKRSTSLLVSGVHTLCGMLNHRGGRVLFGVENDGRIVGQQVAESTLAKIATEINVIEPPAFATIDTIAPDDRRRVIIASVQPGTQRPYSYKGVGYRRSGASTVRLTGQQYQEMLLERLHGVSRWENEIAAGWTVSDLDGTEIVRTLEEAIRRGRAEDPNTRDPVAILQGLGLIKEGSLLRAAVILFAKEEQVLPDYPQCLLRVARFRGVDKTEFLDNRQFRGNAFMLLTRAERFLRENLPVAGRIVPDLFERRDDPLYPPVALREALANAFCHRDYSIGGGSVAVAIFDDRVEITSSGTLHFGLTVEDLYRPHESLPWNPLIAAVFFRRGIIETWGRGTLKMAELAEQAGLPRPEIEVTPGAVLVRFRASRYVAPQRIGHNLTERQQAILRALGSAPSLALRELMVLLPEPVAPSTLRDDLTFLKKLELVGSSGHGRGAIWFLRGHDSMPPP
jgi:ATP-dependent DNA helicase RecG